MFDKELPTNISIYTTTAANEHESSYGEYCSSEAKVNGTLIGSCLGDEYSVRFMEDLDSRPGDEIKDYTLQAQYEYLVKAVTGSHVKQYGDLTIAEKSVADFISKASSNFYMWVKKGIRKILPPKLIAPNDIKINN
jgi:legumain